VTALFVADLHLAPERPAITRAFLDFLAGAEAADLYILGDLFEAWVGDDDPGEPGASVCAALKALVDAGVPVFLMRGNRDFLYGQRMAERCGATLLPDPCVVVLQGVPTLLMHGDLLCTDDAAYQAFRSQVRDPAWQARFLAQPLQARLDFAAQARTASRARYGELVSAGMAETIGDVAPATVREWFARYGVRRMIHGHTHRPAIHGEDGNTRIVLGDWYEQGSVLRVDADGVELATL